MTINSQNIVAINMLAYGIKTIVSTTQERINWYLNEFKTQPDKKFGQGCGKKKLCIFLYKQIKIEDNFFGSNILNNQKHPSRWQEFLDDCVAFSCIHSYLNNCDVPVVDNQKIISIACFLGGTGKSNSSPDSLH